MKKALILICSFAVGATFAQDDKATIKEWKSKLKQLEPLEYKALVEERDELATTVSELEDNVADLETKNAQLQSEIDDYKAQLEEAAAAEATPETTTEDSGVVGASGNTYKTSTAVDGVVFKVQVGAFKNFDLRKYWDNNENFSGEVDEDGTMKYTLGVFKEYWEADKFKKYLRDMGVKGAWVVAYKDGKRVDMKDVLEGVL